MSAASKIRVLQKQHGIRWALLSPSYDSPPDNNSCLSIGRSTFVQLQVLSSFALSPVSSPSRCRSGPGGRMSHCHGSVSVMLFAALLPASLCTTAILLSTYLLAFICELGSVPASLQFVPSLPILPFCVHVQEEMHT